MMLDMSTFIGGMLVRERKLLWAAGVDIAGGDEEGVVVGWVGWVGRVG